MAELSELGRKIIDTAMAHDDPPPVDDSWGAMVSRLTDEASRASLPAESAAAHASSATPRARWLAIAIAIAGALVLVWAWSALRRPKPAPSPKPAQLAAAPTVTTPPVPATLPPTEPPLERLLADAEAALASGDSARAMALLQRHAERAAIHPDAPRRMALRVLVLCAQDEREQAHDEAKALLAAHAQSQWRDLLRRSCVADLIE